VSIHTGMRLSEQYSCTWSQANLDRRTIELTKTKNGSSRAVHLNSDAVGALESLLRPKQRPTDPVFPREGDKGGSIRGHGFIRVWRRPASAATSGTATGTLSAPGLRWPAHRSKRSKNSPATRRLRCLRATTIFRLNTGFLWSIALPHSGNGSKQTAVTNDVFANIKQLFFRSQDVVLLNANTCYCFSEHAGGPCESKI
jgi:hypothetical protein